MWPTKLNLPCFDVCIVSLSVIDVWAEVYWLNKKSCGQVSSILIIQVHVCQWIDWLNQVEVIDRT